MAVTMTWSGVLHSFFRGASMCRITEQHRVLCFVVCVLRPNVQLPLVGFLCRFKPDSLAINFEHYRNGPCRPNLLMIEVGLQTDAAAPSIVSCLLLTAVPFEKMTSPPATVRSVDGRTGVCYSENIFLS